MLLALQHVTERQEPALPGGSPSTTGLPESGSRVSPIPPLAASKPSLGRPPIMSLAPLSPQEPSLTKL